MHGHPISASSDVIISTKPAPEFVNNEFVPLRAALQRRTAKLLEDNPNAVIVRSGLSSRKLFDMYLESYSDPARRQRANCACCRNFFRRHADKAILMRDGSMIPVFFGTTDELAYHPSNTFLQEVEKMMAHATPSEHSDLLECGIESTNHYQHFHFVLPKTIARDRDTRRSFQAIVKSLKNFNVPDLQSLVSVMGHDEAFARNDKLTLRIVTEHLQMRKEIDSSPRRRGTMLWHAAVGDIGARNLAYTVVGQFVADALAGDYDGAKRAFFERTSPKNYMRTVAGPKDGAIDAAEAKFKELGLTEEALKMLPVKPSDIDQNAFIWKTPEATTKTNDSIFGSLKEGVKDKTLTRTVDGGSISHASFMEMVKTKAGEIREINLELSPTRTHTSDEFIYLGAYPASEEGRRIFKSAEEVHFPPCTVLYKCSSARPAIDYGAPANRPNIGVRGVLPAGEGLCFLLETEASNMRVMISTPVLPARLNPEFHSIRAVLDMYGRNNEMRGAEESAIFCNLMVSMPISVRYADDVLVTYTITSLK